MGSVKIQKLLILCGLLMCSSFLNGQNPIEGYCDRVSYLQGDTAVIYLSANSPVTRWIYLRNICGKKVDSLYIHIPHQTISTSNLYPWENGFQFAPVFRYPISLSLPGGVYDWEGKVFFIVKTTNRNVDITFVYPSNTEQAYNNAGGKSLYGSNSTLYQKADIVSFKRPLTTVAISYNRNFTIPFLRWIACHTNFNYRVISDMDLDNPAEISQSKIVCVIGHSEYWTRAARQNFDAFVNSGNDAVILSGNTMWWQARYNATKDQLVCYKSAFDPILNQLLMTLNWNTLTLNYPVIPSIGADYPHGGYHSTTVPALKGFGGYSVVAPFSPLLNGTNLSFHDTLACKSNECDGSIVQGINSYGDPVLDTIALGFCKAELIAYDYCLKDHTSPPTKGYETFLAFKKSYATGCIVNVGSSNWCSSLNTIYPGGIGGKDSTKIKLITSNIFNLLLNNQDIFSSTTASCFVPSNIQQEGNSSAADLQLFPNPAGNEITIIKGDSEEGAQQKLEIYNCLGKLCYEKAILQEEKMIKIEIQNYPPGLYLAVISGGGKYSTAKWMKE